MAKKKLTKRDATPEEEEKALVDNAAAYRRNPSSKIGIDEWRKRLAAAKAEGYKSEVCGCGVTFLAFHHFTTCRREDCPFSDGVSLLQRLEDSIKEE